jgi:hypothetical protein
MKLDPSRSEIDYVTGIYVRAQDDEGRWHSADVARLDEPSLTEWLRSRGGENLWAENVVRILLGWPTRAASPTEASR